MDLLKRSCDGRMSSVIDSANIKGLAIDCSQGTGRINIAGIPAIALAKTDS
jgi:hypothetical protein